MTDNITDISEYVQKEISRGKQYFVLFLKAGPNRKIAPDVAAQNQQKHLEHLFTMHRNGKLPIFGPVLDDPQLEGIAIFDCEQIDEVKALIESDVHIQSGALTYEIHKWFSIPGYTLP